MPRLIIEEDEERRFHRLSEGLTTIGRAEQNAVRITDLKSSRCHCQIVQRNGDFVLQDLQSQNGTRVNDVLVGEHPLAPGDVIQIGQTRITFEVESRKLARVSEDAHPASTPRPPDVSVRPGVRRKTVGRSGRLRRRRSVPLPEPQLPPPGGITTPVQTLQDALREVVRIEGEEGLLQAHAVFEQHLVESTVLRRAHERIETLDTIQQVAKAINDTSEQDLNGLLELIIDAVIDLTGAERGFIILKERNQLSIEAARNFDNESLKNPGMQFSRSIAKRVASSGQAIISTNAQDDERFSDALSVMDMRLRSVLCLPLRGHTDVIGVVYIDNRLRQGIFDEEDLDLLETFADQAAIAIQNARLVYQLRHSKEALRKSKEDVDRLNQLLSERVKSQEVDLVKARELIESQLTQLETKYNYDKIVGASAPMRRVFQLLDKITDSNAPVFIHGESGTGKELVARAIHFNGPRRRGRFVSENCAAISEGLLESELFGYVKGAFTGAEQDKKGLFELASDGTLFLDEVGDMSGEMQKKLLRALQEGEIRPVGSKEKIKVDVRIISASNRDLRKLVEDGEFREDLFYRVNVFTVELPPLRERKDDIPLLVDHLRVKAGEEADVDPPQISKDALRLLMNHDWPGNVRELENELKRAVALADQIIVPDTLSSHIKSDRDRRYGMTLLEGRTLKQVVKDATAEIEQEIIEAILEDCDWKKSRTAKRLGISRPTLDAKIEAYQIQFPER